MANKYWFILGVGTTFCTSVYAQIEDSSFLENSIVELNLKDVRANDHKLGEVSPLIGKTQLKKLTDEEMSIADGQALLNLAYLAPGQAGNTASQNSGVGFYTLSMEANVELNANIKRLQLGCGGVNNSIRSGCDLDMEDVSFGCITNINGACITLPKTEPRQLSGAIQETNAGSVAQAQMKNFVFQNPFFQFAIKNPNSAAEREVVGIRIGSARATGPLSIGSLNQFSGVLTGKANVIMRGETNVGITTYEMAHYKNATAYLGLNDGSVLDIGLFRVGYRDVTADYGTVMRQNLPVELSGTRVTQTAIPGVQLGGVVDELMRDLRLNQVCVRGGITGMCNGLISAVAPVLLPFLKEGVGNYIKGELARGLGKPTSSSQSNHDWLNAYALPYNIKNVHQIDIDSDVFGFALSKQSLLYPGYTKAVNQGWSMYSPDAFTLTIDDKSSNMVSNIATSSNARDGNLTLLAAPYRNCWGNLKFC